MLVAEDDDSLRTMIELVLGREGYRVVACGDGTRAQAALAEASAGEASLDAALLDLRMPGASGAELLRYIRGDERLRSLGVIAMSGYSDALQAQQARAAGADVFLAKPFTVDQLTSTLRSVVGPPRPV